MGPQLRTMVMAPGKVYKIGIKSTPTVRLLIPTNIPPRSSRLLHISSQSNARSNEIMQYFAPLLLLALSPLTVLARPPLAQTALAEHPVVHALNQASSEYKEADELADKVPRACAPRDPYCIAKLVRPMPTAIPIYITRANEQLDIAAEKFVPKVPCADIDSAFLKRFNSNLASFTIDYNTMSVISIVAMEFHAPISDQFSKVDEKLKEIAKDNLSPSRQPGDNLEVTVSFHGADSDGEL
ncbi:MAG: hypothetical protein L6R36_000882 [Xanthoria steineri]|nr:MAG: hypothetical protein L6R36_000882 [Xanthoria steineri]